MLLSLLIFLPLPVLLLLLLVPSGQAPLIRRLGMAALLAQSLVLLGLVLPAFLQPGWNAHGGYLLDEHYSWINLSLGKAGRLAVDYHLAMDGTSLLMVLLTALIMPIAGFASMGIQHRVKAYWALFLLLDMSLMGCFLAQDFFLFYIFYELMLLPMFFLIGMWGGARREYASIKFFLYTLFGSVFMLLIMAGLAMSYIDPEATMQLRGTPMTTDNLRELHELVGMGLDGKERIVHTLDFQYMTQLAANGRPLNLIPGSILSAQSEMAWGLDPRMIAFLILFLGFAIKLPMVPFHTWLPDAHVEAPTPVSVVLAAVLLKVGGYGLLRIAYQIFPDAAVHYSGLLGTLGMISIVYGALIAMKQTDFKAMIAYSSVSHMGFVLLGLASLTPTGMQGAVYQMFNHGIISAALFLLVGVLYARTHDREMAHYQGLWGRMPKYAFVVLLTFFASLGLPGLNGFVSEALSLMGAFGGPWLPKWVAFAAVLGIVLGAVYYLRAFRSMFFGEFSYTGTGDGSLPDLHRSELITLVPLCLLMVVLGFLPGLLLELVDVNLAQICEDLVISGQKLISYRP